MYWTFQTHIKIIGASDKDYSNGCKVALSLLAEFKSIGVLPSLGGYKELINIFITQTKRSFILYEIVDELVSFISLNNLKYTQVSF